MFPVEANISARQSLRRMNIYVPYAHDCAGGPGTFPTSEDRERMMKARRAAIPVAAAPKMTTEGKLSDPMSERWRGGNHGQVLINKVGTPFFQVESPCAILCMWIFPTTTCKLATLRPVTQLIAVGGALLPPYS
jgi:hypothetical protein